ncbi:alpha-xylosidase [Oceanispirochaeta sp.]|jgi:alpha-D-xyloside xylohydrolase|uniref:glycoside hydrolase family 31 protein n=1 Tax=Oceanispirochaeta sp. TaxID=2035350 RepID=UPI00260A3598|nr:alpha-xylosidase [Oceanispirochaeta sp.]MDA3955657.1 alpha-xylosidase [Oceanispirochaeta sp.]
MKQVNDFMADMADFDIHPEAVLWRAGSPRQVLSTPGGAVEIQFPFMPYILKGSLIPQEGETENLKAFTLEAWGDDILHFYSAHHSETPMLSVSRELKKTALTVKEDETGWSILDSHNQIRGRFEKKKDPLPGWSDMIRASYDSLQGFLSPDGMTRLSFSGSDQFFPEKVESLPLAFLSYKEGGKEKESSLFSFQAEYNEHFAGTGERFAPTDIRGKTFVLENHDGLGVNSRRCYKNIPFYLSSRGYGVFMHTSAHIRLSLADISTRAAQARIEEPEVDLFLMGGGPPERILFHYRSLTGFPPELPLWSYGTWMSRMTYFSADEIEEICDRLREEKYPCDVIHIDTGWFEIDWVCEWKFSKKNFPDPAGFMKRLKDSHYRVSLWQTPNIGEGNALLEEAVEKRYLAPASAEGGISSASDFSGQDFGGQIDFSNPEALAWYQSLLKSLFDKGAAVIKTDFGESILMDSDYLNIKADLFHNIYSLYYQKAAFEASLKHTGEGIIWARSAWAGAQRYPIHWGGDAAASWDGMAASLRGGLQLGLSGFGYWSHDVPGFHGLPEFMNTLPTETLYMRWTQFAVFSSHLRYHGTSPREPWHYPGITGMIRKWLNLRYHLIPYFLQEAALMGSSGFPFLRSLLFHSPEDPMTWMVDDQFFCGGSLLVCPVMNDRGVRDVYLPEGCWIDFWTGEETAGPVLLRNVETPLDRLPLYCVKGAEIPVYPELVQSTDEMDLFRVEVLKIDSAFSGWLDSEYAGSWGWT